MPNKPSALWLIRLPNGQSVDRLYPAYRNCIFEYRLSDGGASIVLVVAFHGNTRLLGWYRDLPVTYVPGLYHLKPTINGGPQRIVQPTGLAP